MVGRLVELLIWFRNDHIATAINGYKQLVYNESVDWLLIRLVLDRLPDLTL